MSIETKPFDPVAYLDDTEAIAAYIESALESGEASVVADALGVVARASGMSNLAKETGLSRESLYKSLSADGNPEFSTVLRVTRALGLRFAVEPDDSRSASAK